MRLCIKLISFVAHIIYAWSFSNNIAEPISNNHNNYFLYLNTYNTIFAWVSGNSSKKHNGKHNLYNRNQIKKFKWNPKINHCNHN